MAIARTNGFVPLRRGIFEHVADGRMTIQECFLYMSILADADPATGIWRGSAETLAFRYHVKTRTCRDTLERLERNGYLKRFRISGRKGIYPILVNRFECSMGALTGMRVNTLKSTVLEGINYDECLDGAVRVPGECRDGAVTVPLYREEENKKPGKEEKKKDASPLPDWVPKEAWDGFVEYRKRSKSAWTPRAAKLTIDQLEKLRAQGHDPSAVLDQSVQRGWTGVFAISSGGNTNGRSNYPIPGARSESVLDTVSRSISKLPQANGDKNGPGHLEHFLRPVDNGAGVGDLFGSTGRSLGGTTDNGIQSGHAGGKILDAGRKA